MNLLFQLLNVLIQSIPILIQILYKIGILSKMFIFVTMDMYLLMIIKSHIRLLDFIAGQDKGIEILSDAINSWQFSKIEEDLPDIERNYGMPANPHSSTGFYKVSPEALVIAISGPTGVGKSETAYKLAETLLQSNSNFKSLFQAWGTGGPGTSKTRRVPGLTVIHGGDYSNISYTNGMLHNNRHSPGEKSEPGNTTAHRIDVMRVEWIKNQLKQLIWNTLHSCNHAGQQRPTAGIVIIDEVQKLMPGALEILYPMLGRYGSVSSTESFIETAGTVSAAVSTEMRSHSDTDAAADTGVNFNENVNSKVYHNEKLITYPTNNLIFILVSDIGAEALRNLIFKYKTRERIPIQMLRGVMKQSLDRQWDRLQFSRAISAVVPYLPLEPVHIQEVNILVHITT